MICIANSLDMNLFTGCLSDKNDAICSWRRNVPKRHPGESSFACMRVNTTSDAEMCSFCVELLTKCFLYYLEFIIHCITFF